MNTTGNGTVLAELSSSSTMFYSYKFSLTRDIDYSLYGTLVFITNVVSIIGNSLTVVALSKQKLLKVVPQYIYMINQSVSNILNTPALMIISLNAWSSGSTWKFGRAMCKLVFTFDYSIFAINTLSNILISYDRYLMVTDGATYNITQTRRRVFTKIALMWALAITFWAPAIIFYDLWRGYSVVGDDQCFVEFKPELIFSTTMSVIEYVIPMALIIYFSTSTYVQLKKRARRIRPKHVRTLTKPDEGLDDSEPKSIDCEVFAVRSEPKPVKDLMKIDPASCMSATESSNDIHYEYTERQQEYIPDFKTPVEDIMLYPEKNQPDEQGSQETVHTKVIYNKCEDAENQSRDNLYLRQFEEHIEIIDDEKNVLSIDGECLKTESPDCNNDNQSPDDMHLQQFREEHIKIINEDNILTVNREFLKTQSPGCSYSSQRYNVTPAGMMAATEEQCKVKQSSSESDLLKIKTSNGDRITTPEPSVEKVMEGQSVTLEINMNSSHMESSTSKEVPDQQIPVKGPNQIRISIRSLLKINKGESSKGKGPKQSTSKVKGCNDAAKSLFVGVIVFTLLWTPYFMTNMVRLICEGCHNKYVDIAAEIMCWQVLTVNTFVYLITNKTMRRYYGNVLESCSRYNYHPR